MTENSCSRCGGKLVKQGKRASSNSIIMQRYWCKNCHVSTFVKITAEAENHT